MAFYQNDLIYILNAGDKYLTVDRSNLLLRELPVIQGAENNPSVCFQGDERTGFYLSEEGKIAFTSLGWECLSVSNNELTIYDRSKNSIVLKMSSTGSKTFYFPLQEGTLALREDSQIVRLNNESTDTIYAGMVVKVDNSAGVKKAQSDSMSNLGFALALTQADPTEDLKIIFSGIITLLDWTNVIGATDLTPGDSYYLSDTNAGELVDTPPTIEQYIGIAISNTELLLKV